jgi:sodium-dependent dicarboxylate transporter 2/3/5
LFPVLNVKSINDTVGLYGQTIFFWIWGTVLIGYAMDKHGLAKRFALWFMSLPWIGGSSARIAFGFMLVTALISTVVSDAATIAMMIPVAVSLIAFVRSVEPKATERSNFGAFLSLGALYAAVAGGCATIAGIPHNALSIALLERTTGRTLGWFDWMAAGVPVFIGTLLMFYLVLRFFLPPEFKTVPGGTGFLLKERAQLGRMSRGEKATLFIFSTMVFLFVLPSVFSLALGPQHSLTTWSNRALNLNVVPPLVLLMLFTIPVDSRKHQFVLGWKDAVAHSPWDIMILTTAAAGVVNTLVEFKFVDLAGAAVSGLGLGPLSLPIVAAATVGFTTNLMSGVAATAFFGGIFIPAAQQIGFNPASMAILIPNAAVGFVLPWAGASTGTAFATGQLTMKNMIKIGTVATIGFVAVTTITHLLLAPFV